MDTDWDTTYMALTVQGFMDKSPFIDDKVWGQFLRKNGYRVIDRVQGMMRSGEMSQSDFERCRQMANMMTGKNY